MSRPGEDPARAGAGISRGAPPAARRQLLSGAFRLGLGTFVSRLLGLGRDMTRAYLFGTGAAADAFTVAFRIPNLLRALFAEGALSAAFVPVLSGYLETGEREATERFLRAATGALLVAVSVTALLGIALAPALVPLLVRGFDDVPGKVELTVRLTQWLFPYILLIALATLFMGVLNAHRHFTAPALAPALLNLVLIAGALWLCPLFGEAPEQRVYGLALAVLVGGLLQAAVQLPPLLRRGLRPLPMLDLKHPGLRRVLLLMLPGLLGIGVQELNAFVDTFMASGLPSGSVSALEYGQRVMQLPLGVFAVALGTAVLPTLSRQIVRGEHRDAEATTGFSVRLGLLVLVPAALWLILLAEPIVTLLFRRGAFATADSIRMTASALAFFSVGLPAYGTAKSLVPLFFAHQDTKTPVRAAVAALVTNVILNLILMRYLALGGLALATALSSMLNVFLLSRWARRQLGLDPFRGVARFSVALLIPVLASAAALLVVLAWASSNSAPGTWGILRTAVLPLVAGALVYALALQVTKLEEWVYLRGVLSERFRGARAAR